MRPADAVMEWRDPSFLGPHHPGTSLPPSVQIVTVAGRPQRECSSRISVLRRSKERFHPIYRVQQWKGQLQHPAHCRVTETVPPHDERQHRIWHRSALPLRNMSCSRRQLNTFVSIVSAGGTSDLLTVGDPLSGASCNTNTPSISFDFQLLSSLQQCREYNISDFTTAIAPVTIYGTFRSHVPNLFRGAHEAGKD